MAQNKTDRLIKSKGPRTSIKKRKKTINEHPKLKIRSSCFKYVAPEIKGFKLTI